MPPHILLTIDVEDWFQVENLKSAISFESWPTRELRVERNTHKLLDLFDSIDLQPATGNLRTKNSLKATFFVLGWLAERLPHLIREIQARGHEIACHGFGPQLCTKLTAAELRRDLTDSKKLLEDIAGEAIYGYRAPSFAVSDEILKLIEDCGFLYDSSYNSFAMYGLTEGKRVSYLPPDQLDKRPDSVGIPIPNEEVFVVDDNGKELPPGQVGELVIRGSNVMQGYWNAPEETAKRSRPGRYRGEVLLYSGDLFRRDEEGYLYFVARKDDMIKTKGERVSPKEIENALCELEGVAEAAVIGVPDDIFGQAIKAFVVRKKESEIVEKEVVGYCTKNLEPFMVPKYVEFVEVFPKSASGKIDKKALN